MHAVSEYSVSRGSSPSPAVIFLTGAVKPGRVAGDQLFALVCRVMISRMLDAQFAGS